MINLSRLEKMEILKNELERLNIETNKALFDQSDYSMVELTNRIKEVSKAYMILWEQ